MALGLAAVVTMMAASDRAGHALVSGGWFGLSAREAVATAALRSGDQVAARAGERAAADIVAHAPLRRSAVSLLASLRALTGDGDGAARAFAIAAGQGWRDVAAQGWAVDQALSGGQPAIAALRMEALLRVAPADPVTAALLRAVAADPPARTLLAAAMGTATATGADWPMATLEGLGALPPPAAADRVALLAQARADGFRAEARVLRSRARALYQDDPARAFALWVALTGLGDTAKAGLWDTGFAAIDRDEAAGVAPFEWQRERTATAALTRGEAAGHARLVVSGGGFAAEPVAYVAATVAPGRYALTWRASRTATGAPALTLRPACTGAGRALDSGPILDRGDESGMALTVPAGCTAIRITAFAPATGSGERWLADPALRRVRP